MSTFNGLEMAKQALFAQQSALRTTGHNISNANTEGYTRQRVNFETTSPFPPASRNRPEIAGQMGTGVESGTVQRIRNEFLDNQYRTENGSSEYWDAKAGELSRMEDLMNEPSENGLSNTMNQFWQSLEDLSVNPEDSGARSVVAQRGRAVTETFNYLSDSLSSMRTDQKNQINVKVEDANSLTDQISAINEQVKNIETNGQMANDLYDERDRLIDELSGIVNIDVSYTKSSSSAPDKADGLATINLANENNNAINNAKLVNGDPSSGLSSNNIEVNIPDGAVSEIQVSGTKIADANKFTSAGSLKGLIDSYGYTNGTDGNDDPVVKGDFPDMMADLDTMAQAFAEKFNDVHSTGNDLQGNQGIDDFFQSSSDGTEAISAGNITVNQTIQDDPNLIAASNGNGSGDGGNASDLSEVFDDKDNNDATDVAWDDSTSVNSFYESLIGDMGVKAQEANRMVENTEILRSQVEQQRMSVSSVSLDEEMSDMIKYQHAYNAAARSMTAMDEMLDRVINNMGLVGR